MARTYSTILISNEADNALFDSLLDRLKTEFKAEFIERVEDLDSKYCDFKITDIVLTIHQQTFIGITLFPKELNEASKKENLLAETIGYELKYSISKLDT